MKKFLLIITLIFSSEAYAAGNIEKPKELRWSFDGLTGTFDRQSIQRGYQVYKEVCASCHSLRLVSFRNLNQVGFSEAEIKTIAATYNYNDGPNDQGEMFERPGLPSDRFPNPYPNEKAARAANGGAYPPDLSLIVKARHDGANYLYSLLTGYGQKAPHDLEIGEGQYYNPYMPGGRIAMPAPLLEGQVSYQDGTAATVDQMSRDVVNFLHWTAEPEMEHRKKMGIKVLIFLTITAVFFYIAKCRIWARLNN